MKFFRVATAGATVDGRSIAPEHLEQMAEQYNPKVYNARIWLEHCRSLLANGAFPAYGDVLALKCEKDEQGKTVLLAQIQASPELLEINRRGQKLYTSVEINPSFADTGKAYLMGLAITDSPASIGTERLMFSAQQQEKDHLFSNYEPCDEQAFAAANEGGSASTLNRFWSWLQQEALQTPPGSERTAATAEEEARREALQALNVFMQGQQEQLQRHSAILQELREEWQAFMETQTPPTKPGRPPVGSGSTDYRTNC